MLPCSQAVLPSSIPSESCSINPQPLQFLDLALTEFFVISHHKHNFLSKSIIS